MQQKLSPSEIEGYKNFIRLYEEFSKNITKYQEGLEKIEEEKNNLMESLGALTKQLDKVRDDEQAFNDKLVAKYGEFSLNLENFEITIE